MERNETNLNRKEQIIKDFETSGVLSKELYAKKDIEPELRKFQNMIVNKVFEETHGENLRIEDVQLHINKLAEEQNLLNNDKIIEFNHMSDAFSKLLAQEISGNKGERKMLRNINMIQIENEYITNVELNNDSISTEIDGIVITSKAIFLLESKYSTNDMYISADGNYCRADNPSIIYGNIGDKINDKEYMIRNTLKIEGFDKPINIIRVLVYTNNDTKLINYYSHVKDCYYNNLHYFIEEFESEDIYSKEDMIAIKSILKDAIVEHKYPIKFDHKKYLELFADVLSLTEHSIDMDSNEASITKDTNSINWKKVAMYSAMPALLTIVVTSKIIKKII